ncbi:hypothetical protein P170DRAFT_472245 [Aspergillus steynii IBT 23096]|uniref:Uncharacterized protein n=1 Tax=Aspergillus steynii IBT 23096 TaxID=1392250 RepID=A0A2I2GHJ1_9EURO|nr:uncharacterized protein P170DRAFT_472245 [Aspergillus steynii IBT 23096]PLB52345.1 hypothetical protein P170DRAFT_472245 [Aspergillus steynii IBT 23096]
MKFIILCLFALLHLAAAAKSKWYNAGWPVGDKSWKPTDYTFARETGIDRYRLYDAGGRIYTYQLDIHVADGESGWLRTYVFEDSTADEYTINAFRDGEHSVSFNSEDAYILRVKDTETWYVDPLFVYAFYYE